MNNSGCWRIMVREINGWGPGLDPRLPMSFPSREEAENHRSNKLQDPTGKIYDIYFEPEGIAVAELPASSTGAGN